jgi:alanine racemase
MVQKTTTGKVRHTSRIELSQAAVKKNVNFIKKKNRGQVLIHGRKAPVAGLINMNLFMVDISYIENVRIDDEVVLLGKQKNNVIKVRSFTDATSLLNNEMLSRLPTAIPRTIVR